MLTFTQADNLEQPVYLIGILLDSGRGSWSTSRERTRAHGEHANSAQKGQSQNLTSDLLTGPSVLVTSPRRHPQENPLVFISSVCERVFTV